MEISHPVGNPDPACGISCPVSDTSPGTVYQGTSEVHSAVLSTEPQGITNKKISKEITNTC